MGEPEPVQSGTDRVAKDVMDLQSADFVRGDTSNDSQARKSVCS
jgi:hypothetical protein